jgi:hypothetical protein
MTTTPGEKEIKKKNYCSAEQFSGSDRTTYLGVCALTEGVKVSKSPKENSSNVHASTTSDPSLVSYAFEKCLE